MKEIQKPIGMDEICFEIERLCMNPREGNKIPGPYMVHLDEGDGITTLVNYVEDMLSENEIMDFSYVLDKSMEMRFDKDLKAFELDRTGAVYKSNYTGIEFHILTEAFAKSYYADHYKEYVEQLKKIKNHAMLFFILPRNPSKNMDELKAVLVREFIGNNENHIFEVPEYSYSQLAKIAMINLEETGVTYDLCDFEKVFLNELKKREVRNVKDALQTLNTVEEDYEQIRKIKHSKGD